MSTTSIGFAIIANWNGLSSASEVEISNERNRHVNGKADQDQTLRCGIRGPGLEEESNQDEVTNRQGHKQRTVRKVGECSIDKCVDREVQDAVDECQHDYCR